MICTVHTFFRGSLQHTNRYLQKGSFHNMALSLHRPIMVTNTKRFFLTAALLACAWSALLPATAASLSSSQAATYEQQARQQGYSPEQIEALKAQYGVAPTKTARQTTDSATAPFADSLNVIDTMYREDSLAQEKRLHIPDTANTTLPYFGYNLFKNTPEAFKPNALGPVDPGYLVGPGDALRISVWGQAEFQYELQVSKEGKILIPVAGQLYVTGVPFDKLQDKIQNLLSKHYSGLASNPQNTFIDVTIAQIRPIRIFIMGEVSAPGGYTVSSTATAFNALYSIGGPTIKGTLRNIDILRNNAKIATVDFYDYLISGSSTTDVRLQNNDVILVPPRGKTVAAVGSVIRPAIYELTDDENLQALLTFCGGLPPETNLTRAKIERVIPFAQRTASKTVVKIIDLALKNYIDQSTDLALYNNDTLRIVPLYNDLKNYVTLSGAVKYPGTYQCDSLMLSTLVFTLGQPIERTAFTKRADLIRLNSDLQTTTTTPLNLDSLQVDPAKDIPLQPFDEVIVYQKTVEKPLDLLITIEGEVQFPGTYAMSTNLTATDAILRAGGLTRAAFRNSIDVFRATKKDTLLITEAFTIELPDSLDYTGKNATRFLLHDRDRIVVRPDPSYIIDNYVTVQGEVRLRGTYAIQMRGERLSDVISRAGGTLPDAFLEGATISRRGERIVVNFADALYRNKKSENVLLQKGDSIFVPTKPNTVLIAGNVNNPGLFSFIPDLRVKKYIDRAGGMADSSAYILLKSPSGETRKIGRCGFNNPGVKEGSEIIVVKKPAVDKSNQREGPSVSEVIRDTLAIVVSAVSVIALLIKIQ